jgi:ABC-type transport system involved in multi-copper enzyme maturation permease subunit
VTGVWTIAGYGLREAVRRKVFVVVCLLTLAFLALYWIGNRYTFHHVGEIVPPAGIDAQTFAGAFLFGMAMFGTLFLGVVLAVFLTLGVVRGDAERGLLQPLVVRPIGRGTVLAARFLGAAAVCVPYVIGVYFATMVLTGLEGSWWPDRIVTPGLELAGGVLLVAALSLLGSVFLSGIANGIAVFMLFGAGLVAGLLDNIGHVLNSGGLVHAAKIAAWIVPFEALYQDALRAITENTSGLTGFLLRLGPFGGAEQGGVTLRLWAVAYLGIVSALALAGFARRDL